MNLAMRRHTKKGKARYLDWIACLAFPWVYVDYTWIRSIIKMVTLSLHS